MIVGVGQSPQHSVVPSHVRPRGMFSRSGPCTSPCSQHAQRRRIEHEGTYQKAQGVAAPQSCSGQLDLVSCWRVQQALPVQHWPAQALYRPPAPLARLHATEQGCRIEVTVI